VIGAGGFLIPMGLWMFVGIFLILLYCGRFIIRIFPAYKAGKAGPIASALPSKFNFTMESKKPSTADGSFAFFMNMDCRCPEIGVDKRYHFLYSRPFDFNSFQGY